MLMNFDFKDPIVKKIGSNEKRIIRRKKEVNNIITSKENEININENNINYEEDFINVYGNIIPLGKRININKDAPKENKDKMLDSSEITESNEQNNVTSKIEISKEERYLLFLKEITEKVNKNVEFINSRLNILKRL